MVTKTLELKIWENNNIAVYAHRGEVDSRYIEASFKTQDQNSLELAEKTVTFYAEKPDGTKIFNDCIIDMETNTATIMLTSQMLCVPGVLNCEFQIFNDINLLLKVTGLKIIVSDETDFSEAIESTSEFNALVESVNNAKKISEGVGNTSELNTEEKSTIVGAINEINTKVWPISQGGTNGTTQVEALTNLGIVDTSTTGFNTSNVDDFVAQVKTYVENNLQVGVPLFFGANNSARGSYGAAFAWSMSPNSKTIFLYNGSTGIRVYNWNTSNGWQKGSLG